MNRAKIFVYVSLIALFAGACSKESPEQVESASSNSSGAAVTVTEKSSKVATPTPQPAPEPEAPAPVVAETEKPVAEPPTAEERSADAAPAESQEHIVKGVITQWQPLVTFAQPGDKVRFSNMTGHDTQSMEGMIPEGATPWKSKLGEEGFTITVEKEGAYVYKCNPHITTGMVGIIVVGERNPSNLAALEENAGNVKIGGNMVKRAIRKLKKQLESS